MVQVTRDAAVALFMGLGYKSAEKSSAKRLEGKLARLNEMVEGKDCDKLPFAIRKTLSDCLDAIVNGDTIEVIESVPKERQEEGTEDTTQVAQKDVPVEVPKTPKTKEKVKVEDKTKPEKAEPKQKRVLEARESVSSRPYLAGQIIAKHGLEADVTDAMVAELDKAYGYQDQKANMAALRRAHRAICGYLGKEFD